MRRHATDCMIYMSRGHFEALIVPCLLCFAARNSQRDCKQQLALQNGRMASNWVGSNSLTPNEVAIRSVSPPSAIVKTSHMPLRILAYRRGWFEEGRKNCMCCCHRGGRLEAKLEMALEVEADARRAAADPAGQDCTVEAAAVDTASMRMHEAQAAIVKRDTYESMTRDVEALHRALLPCGKVLLLEYTQNGARAFWRTSAIACMVATAHRESFRVP